MTIAEASREYGVPHDTIRKRIWYDIHHGKSMRGVEKVGRDWTVTRNWMETKEWRKQK